MNEKFIIRGITSVIALFFVLITYYLVGLMSTIVSIVMPLVYILLVDKLCTRDYLGDELVLYIVLIFIVAAMCGFICIGTFIAWTLLESFFVHIWLRSGDK
jgi:hypothetical protein